MWLGGGACVLATEGGDSGGAEGLCGGGWGAYLQIRPTLARSINIRIANRISVSVTGKAVGWVNSAMIGHGLSPRAGVRMPSAIVSNVAGFSGQSGRPATRLAERSFPYGSTLKTRVFGEAWAVASATPAAMPPPLMGTSMASSSSPISRT